MQTKLNDGALVIDVASIMERLTGPEKREIALHLATEADVFGYVVEQLAQGIVDPDNDGKYWCVPDDVLRAGVVRVLDAAKDASAREIEKSTRSAHYWREEWNTEMSRNFKVKRWLEVEHGIILPVSLVGVDATADDPAAPGQA